MFPIFVFLRVIYDCLLVQYGTLKNSWDFAKVGLMRQPYSTGLALNQLSPDGDECVHHPDCLEFLVKKNCQCEWYCKNV